MMNGLNIDDVNIRRVYTAQEVMMTMVLVALVSGNLIQPPFGHGREEAGCCQLRQTLFRLLMWLLGSFIVSFMLLPDIISSLFDFRSTGELFLDREIL